MGFVMDGLDAEAYDRTYSDRALAIYSRASTAAGVSALS